MRQREAFDRPHEGTLSSAPTDLVGKMRYLNDTLDRLMNELENVERGLHGSPPPVPTRGEPDASVAPVGHDGLVYQIDLAITRATGLLGQADSNSRPFRPTTAEGVRR